MNMDRSLAFTALLELSQTFRTMEAGAGSKVITRLVDDFRAAERAYSADRPCQGACGYTCCPHCPHWGDGDNHPNLYDYTRLWIAQGGIERKEEEAGA